MHSSQCAVAHGVNVPRAASLRQHKSDRVDVYRVISTTYCKRQIVGTKLYCRALSFAVLPKRYFFKPIIRIGLIVYFIDMEKVCDEENGHSAGVASHGDERIRLIDVATPRRILEPTESIAFLCYEQKDIYMYITFNAVLAIRVRSWTSQTIRTRSSPTVAQSLFPEVTSAARPYTGPV